MTKRAGRESFGRDLRIRRRADFDRVYQSDVFAADQVLVVRGSENELDVCRLGLSISRRVGNAVHRNRWKRIIREAFRKQYEMMPAGLDLVVRPRKGAACDARAVHKSLPRLAQRISGKLRGKTR